MVYARFAGATAVNPFRVLATNGPQDRFFQRFMYPPISERAATEKAALHR
jgi:hypothetical protein